MDRKTITALILSNSSRDMIVKVSIVTNNQYLESNLKDKIMINKRIIIARCTGKVNNKTRDNNTINKF
jgi:hypothetical protein